MSCKNPNVADELAQAQAVSRRVAFTGKGAVSLVPFEVGELAEGEVIVRTSLSLMSTGTENIVFNRLFAPGTHWDGWVKYPFYPGYAVVGVVEAVGPGVAGLRAGQRVACRASHASHARLKAEMCFPVPEGLELEEAVWFAFAKIAFMGARVADYTLGDPVLVIGAGPIGQMAVRWSAAAGCFTTVLDRVAQRLDLARSGGATAVVDGLVDDSIDAILAAGDGRRPRVVVDSTGNSAVFASALRIVADRGTLVVLGDTGAPAEQRLTSDVISRGLHIVGAHDVHNTPEWNDASISRLFFALVGDGRFNVGGLVSHRFAPEDCVRAYTLANTERGSTMGIVFDWRT